MAVALQRNKEYWEERAVQMEKASHKDAQTLLYEIESQYRTAQKEIESQMSVWYQRFATNNQIDLREAKRLLNTRELKEFKWTVDDYIKYGRENAINGQWMKQLENASSRFHVTRLQALQLEQQQTIEKLFSNQQDAFDAHMKKTALDSYFHTAFEVQKGVGVGFDVAAISDKALGKIITTPWTSDGRNFSDRIWSNKNALIGEVRTQLTQNLMLGKAPDESIKLIAEKFGVSEHQAGRLVMTESAYFASVAKGESYKMLGIKRFKIVATLDDRTSDVCRDLDGQVFDLKDFAPGATAPPFHPWCRSTTSPYHDDMTGVGERYARDETGKSYFVPRDMKYRDWEKTFVQGGTKQGLTPAFGSGTVKMVTPIGQCLDFGELTKYFKNTYSIDIHSDVTKLDFKAVREGMEGIERVIKEFPSSQATIKSVGTNSSGIMCASFNGQINFNPSYFLDGNVKATCLVQGNWRGFHPMNNTILTSGSHEMGHLLERTLVENDSTLSHYEKIVAWNKGKKAAEVIHDAVKLVKKDPEGMLMAKAGMKTADFVADVSGYAKANRSECLAECVADYVANGQNAQILSRKVWGILKGLIK